VQRTRVIPPASQRELEQRDSSASFAFTITSIEGSFQKARVIAYVASLLCSRGMYKMRQCNSAKLTMHSTDVMLTVTIILTLILILILY